MKKIIAIWLCTLLFSSSTILFMGINEIADGATIVSSSNYTIYPPIKIDSNADFDAAHGISSGDGSEINPWIIENYDIDGSGFGYCIYIGNTTDYFLIRDCYLHDASGGTLTLYKSGITIETANNGIIENNTIDSNDDMEFICI